LYWAGREDEASDWLTQARLLEERFIERPPHSAVLLQARIALLNRRTDEARAALRWLASRDLPGLAAGSARALHSALLHVLQAETTLVLPSRHLPLSWPEIEALSLSYLDAERAELEYWRLRTRSQSVPRAARQLWLEEAAKTFIAPAIWPDRLRKLVGNDVTTTAQSGAVDLHE
jgi:hypothetical protein